MQHRRRKPAYINDTLIIVNILYFLWLEFCGSTENAWFMVEHGAMYVPLIVKHGEYYRLLTSVFMHFGISHLVNNMIIQFVLGDNLERALGRIKYLVFYLVCGVGANVFSMIVSINDYEPAVSAGASGAIFGVIGGLLYAVIRNRGQLEDLSTRQLTMLVVCSLYFGFTSTGVDNAAHIGGLVLGFLLGVLFYTGPEERKPYAEEGGMNEGR
ncbi:rhomboid family intramembrane serine protease [Lachnoclostridium sp. An14]|uniref:rhomboid family intramembrane serine protease n=1 Tax=Lachnoclostridium sp. An14 TaxID=1965562 RepID=UPI000B36B9EE|nr:rhomboid family intramembrane serine protease [Lachnoclostridium sp. An14]OUQ20167.1 rhomboid family intramembrane serine protease [Lachnoclostridium sp. An14]